MHTVSFGPYNAVLRRITQIALDVQNNTPPDPNAPAAARVDSSYAEALDSVSLNQRLVFVRSHLSFRFALPKPFLELQSR